MINLIPLNHLRYYSDSESVIPNYNGFSFLNIMPTVYNLFGIDNNDICLDKSYFQGIKKSNINKVALIFIDAFGWETWNNFEDLESIKKFKSLGVVSPLYSLFPSSTAPSVATLNYNRSPIEHGILDTRLFLNEFKESYWTFTNNPVIKERQSLHSTTQEMIASEIHPNVTTTWEVLSNAGIDCEVITHKGYIKSHFNKHITKGAKVIPYITQTEGLALLKESLNSKDKKVVEFYTDSIDLITHKYGTDSELLKNEVDSLLNSLYNLVINQVDLNETLILIFADHGQINCDSGKKIFLDHEIENFDEYLVENNFNEPIYPCGSGRSVFLHVKSHKIEELTQLLRSKLEDKAHVYLRNEIIESGLLGNRTVKDELLSRVGDIVIIPKGNYVIWHSHPDLGSDKIATHGGLSREEVLSCLVAI